MSVHAHMGIPKMGCPPISLPESGVLGCWGLSCPWGHHRTHMGWSSEAYFTDGSLRLQRPGLFQE